MKSSKTEKIKQIIQERVDMIAKNTGMPLEVAFKKLKEDIKLASKK